jgi:anhydro-N-acetylmuramic acid kinase
LRIIGLMSGTSMDGVDAAFIETDGVGHLALGENASTNFDPDFRAALRSFVASVPERGASPQERSIEATLTDLHVRAVESLLSQMKMRPDQIDLIGFHGQTIWHRPQVRETWQMGDAQRLADATGITVVSDFRSADVKAGGQGAPLVPAVHAALARDIEKPAVIVNIGGVGNITWIGGDQLLAFDTGPGNGLIDDWVSKHARQPMDEGGRIAAAGRVNVEILQQMLTHKYFDKRPPKSLDRHDFTLAPVASLSTEDGAATLTAFTAATIAAGLNHCPEKPKRLLVTGGGRHNPTMMAFISKYAGVPAESVDSQGWQGDAVEAQAFAYLAARSVRGLPITFPGTTGIAAPMTGGVVTPPSRLKAANA